MKGRRPLTRMASFRIFLRALCVRCCVVVAVMRPCLIVRVPAAPIFAALIYVARPVAECCVALRSSSKAVKGNP